MKRDMQAVETIREKFEAIRGALDERARRLWAAAEARSLGYGGDAAVSAATGIARATIRGGRRELEAGPVLSGRLRKPGGGRPRLVVLQPTLQSALEALVSPLTRGDPESPLRWTTKSRAHLTAELRAQGFRISSSAVGRMLNKMGYSLQAIRKRREGADHPDRDAQFEYINTAVREAHANKEPVISVDTKKKELVGEFKKDGQEWQPKGQPEEALVHDFITDAAGKAIPYGVYDVHRNEAWVNVGNDHDTAAFAVESIRKWWKLMGRRAYRGAKRLLITSDCGGSNGYRPRAWKVELQKLADETGLRIDVCHFPPGTSKWNAIEHRLFSFLSINWRGRMLVTYETVVKLIKATTTAKGLRVRAALDQGKYPTGIRHTDAEMAALNLHRSTWHGEWNYSLLPTAS